MDNSNRILLVDPKYRFILGVVQLTKTSTDFDIPVQLESISPISNLPILKYDFDKYIELFSNTDYYLQGLTSPASYIFTENEEFKVRPRILTYLLDGISGNLSLSTKYTCCVEYFDPDDINFKQYFNFIKFKDRYGFLNIRKELKLDADNKAYIKFKSLYPGVCKFRSKDSAYLCSMSTLQCRFIQEVIEDEI